MRDDAVFWGSKCWRKWGLSAGLFGSLKPFPRRRRHYTPRGTSRLRCWYRFTRAKAARSHSWFFFKPRYRTLVNPKTRFRMRNGCSTLARTRALVVFFRLACSSARFLNLVRRQVTVHRVPHLAAQIVLLQQMAEAKDRGLIRRRGHAQVDSGEAPQCRRLIESLFHARVRQAEPLLQKVRPQHDRQTYRLPAVAGLGLGLGRSSLSIPSSNSRSSLLKVAPSSRSGRFRKVFASDCLRRQRRISS